MLHETAIVRLHLRAVHRSVDSSTTRHEPRHIALVPSACVH